MSAPFENTILSVAPIPPGFHVRVIHHETYQGEHPKIVDRHEFPVIGWAVVRRDDWSSSKENASVEPVFLWNGNPTVTSEYRAMFSDLTPAPGEPKQTVGVTVIHPEDCR